MPNGDAVVLNWSEIMPESAPGRCLFWEEQRLLHSIIVPPPKKNKKQIWGCISGLFDHLTIQLVI